MEIRLKYINQDSFYGSDYFIKRVDYEEKWDRVKRLGDTYYENELLERSVTEKYGSNLKIGKVENTAAAIGTTGNGKLSIDEYVGHDLENVDKLKTVGASVGVSASGITSLGVNYSDRKQEGITKNTVIGNVEIGKSSGAEINKDLGSMTEITKDRDFKTDINIESQTINYIKNPEKFKEDLQIALIEGKATGRTVVKTIDNMINGDKSQDIGDAERRSLIEIKEAIVRVQTAPAMDIIAEKDLADKNIQARLGVEIEKFDPNDPTLSEKVKERIDELKAEGKEIVAFYDKVTKKIFINQNAKDEEVRASIAREYKIKEDLELGRGKANDKGQLRSTVAGEIAYEEIQKRIAKNKANPIDIAKLDNAQMNPDSEVTGDIITEEDKKFRKYYKEEVLPNDPNYKVVKEVTGTGISMVLDFSVLGESKGITEAIFGVDAITGEKLDTTTRILGLIPLAKELPKLRNLFKTVKTVKVVLSDGSKISLSVKEAKKLEGMLDDINKSLIKEGEESLTKALTKTENGKTLTEINKTEKALENTDEISDTIKKVLEENKIGTDDLAKTNKVTVVNNISNYDSAKYRSRITNNPNSANKVKTSSQILDKELQKAGVKKPLYNCAAHHIVSDKMDEIVDFFNKYDIDINSASNGVYLPTKGAKTSEVGKAAIHIGANSEAYRKEIIKRIKDTVGKAEESYKNLNQFQKDKKIKKAILDEMDNIKKDLLEGNLKINNAKLKN